MTGLLPREALLASAAAMFNPAAVRMVAGRHATVNIGITLGLTLEQIDEVILRFTEYAQASLVSSTDLEPTVRRALELRARGADWRPLRDRAEALVVGPYALRHDLIEYVAALNRAAAAEDAHARGRLHADHAWVLPASGFEVYVGSPSWRDRLADAAEFLRVWIRS